jgi:tRNA A37 methylthiotransferase MiaB
LVLGIESGSDNVLLKMGKLNKTPTAEKVLKRAKGAGITVAINIMIGFPGEHQQDFEDTLEFLRRNQPWIDRLDSVSTVQIVDNTPLMQKAVQLGVILPERNPHNRWYTLDGNTIEERQRRLRIVLESAQELGIEIGRTFLETETTKKLDLKYDNNPQRMWRRWLNRLGYLTWN